MTVSPKSYNLSMHNIVWKNQNDTHDLLLLPYRNLIVIDEVDNHIVNCMILTSVLEFTTNLVIVVPLLISQSVP